MIKDIIIHCGDSRKRDRVPANAKFWRFPRTRGDRPHRLGRTCLKLEVPPHARG